MKIQTKELFPESLRSKLVLPQAISHKGENGKVLVIGGSSLFHAASLWSAETLSHFADMVHYSSTVENQELFQQLKLKFRNGIIIHKKDIPYYVKEDDVILIGPGMVRGEVRLLSGEKSPETFEEIMRIEDEATYAHFLSKYLLENFPEKKFVIDAGALQMIDPQWLKKTKHVIVTPHQKEFQTVFGINMGEKNTQEKETIVTKVAQEFGVTILLKAITDFVSDGKECADIEGGNAGLTKGGTGDVLAALTAAFYIKQTSTDAAILASYILKKTADTLFMSHGYWYNTSNLIEAIPIELAKLARATL